LVGTSEVKVLLRNGREWKGREGKIILKNVLKE
jgi:hypothetical protein